MTCYVNLSRRTEDLRWKFPDAWRIQREPYWYSGRIEARFRMEEDTMTTTRCYSNDPFRTS
jgi:hypothetical protein